MSIAKREILGQHATKTVASLLILLVVHSASADVTITERSGSRESSPKSDRVRRIMIKGRKMRIESQSDKKLFVTVYDLDAGQEMVWEAKGKTASVFDLSVESEKHKKAMKTLKSSMQPAGQTGKVLGATCEQFNYEISVSTPAPQPLVSTLTGTLCVSREIPGSRDFAEFADEAKTQGYFLGLTKDIIDPRSALFFAVADLNGLVLEKTEKWEMRAVPGVPIYGVPASVTYSEITDITNDPVPDDLFRIPDGRKITKDRTVMLSVPVRLHIDQTRSALARAGCATKN